MSSGWWCPLSGQAEWATVQLHGRWGSANTVKSFCRRNTQQSKTEQPFAIDAPEHNCLCCGVPVEQNAGRKEVLLWQVPKQMVECPPWPDWPQSDPWNYLYQLRKDILCLWSCGTEVLLPLRFESDKSANYNFVVASLAEKVSEPNTDNDENFYHITQCLSHFLKDKGYDGIIYSQAL